MAIGISTACFYPETTENSLIRVGECGAKVAEVFINSPCELERGFIDNLNKIKNDFDLKVKSVHTYASFAESYFYFSEYERRFYDSLDSFKRYFYAAKTLGADFIVIHGFRNAQAISNETFFKRYEVMYDLAAQEGLTLTQENVVNYCSGTPDFLLQMQEHLKEKFKMTLDIKQARRAGYSPYDFVDKLSESIVHIHISDFSDTKDCIAPLTGKFDFHEFFTVMKDKGYDGDYIIELYKSSFNNISELIESRTKLSYEL